VLEPATRDETRPQEVVHRARRLAIQLEQSLGEAGIEIVLNEDRARGQVGDRVVTRERVDATASIEIRTRFRKDGIKPLGFRAFQAIGGLDDVDRPERADVPPCGHDARSTIDERIEGG
jgi:hypothetical protein